MIEKVEQQDNLQSSEHESTQTITRPIPDFAFPLYESTARWVYQHHRQTHSLNPTEAMLEAAGGQSRYQQLLTDTIADQVLKTASMYNQQCAAWQTTRYHTGAQVRLTGFEPYFLGQARTAHSIQHFLVSYFQELIDMTREKQKYYSQPDKYWLYRRVLFLPNEHRSPTEIAAAAAFFGGILGTMTHVLRKHMTPDAVAHREHVYRRLRSSSEAYSIRFVPDNPDTCLQSHVIAKIPRYAELESTQLDEADIDDPAVILHKLGQTGDAVVRALLDTMQHPSRIHLPANEKDVQALTKKQT